MTKKEKRELIKTVVERLKLLYADAKCSLEYNGEGWKLLVMGTLSAQCTDERVNIVCKSLFCEFPTAKALADGEISKIEEIIKPCGLYRMKAKNIKSQCHRLVYHYGGVVPDTMEDLLTLDGVGRKVANLLLGDLYNKPAIVADTHCMRICGRLGMYAEGQKDPLKTEKIMSELVEPSEQSDLCHRFVLFGREYCTARAPKCNACTLKDICKSKNNK